MSGVVVPALLTTPARRENLTTLLADQRHTVPWFERQQEYLRLHQPPALIVWGPNDGYMPEGAARAYLRDLPDAELHMTDGGHWLLETHLGEVVPLVRDFLDRCTRRCVSRNPRELLSRDGDRTTTCTRDRRGRDASPPPR